MNSNSIFQGEGENKVRYPIVCSCIKDDVIKEKLLGSLHINEHDLYILNGYDYKNVPEAFNKVMEKIDSPVIIFVHEDIVLGDNFFVDLERTLDSLKSVNWAVLGIAGAITTSENDDPKNWIFGNMYDSTSGKILGGPEGLPREVDTLDECLFVLRKDSGLRFDEDIPSTQFFFAADISLQAKEKGLKSFAIDAFCEHHSSFKGKDSMSARNKEQYCNSYGYMKKKWASQLPFRVTYQWLE